MRLTRRESTYLPVAIFVTTLLLNLLGASYISTEGDAWGETERAASGELMLRPHHLLLTCVNQATLGAFRVLGFTGRAFIPLQAANALLGALASVLLFSWFARFPVSTPAAAAGCAIWAVSASPWYHSRTAETGIAAIPFALGAILLIVPRWQQSPARSLWRVVLASALLSCAVLLNFAPVLLVPGLLVAVWFYTPSQSSRRVRLAAAVGTLFVTGFIPFRIAASAGGASTLPEFMHWLIYRPDGPGFSAGINFFNALRSLTGVSRLMFPISDGETAIKAVLLHEDIAHSPLDFVTLARNLGALIGLGGAALWGMWRLRRTPLAAVSATALLPTALFNLYWLGSDPQYWLHVYPFLLAFAAVGGSEWIRRGSLALGPSLLVGLGAILLASNLPSGAPSPLWPSGDDRWQRAERIGRQIQQRALIVKVGVARSPFEFIQEFRPDVEVLITPGKELDGVRGPAFLEWVDKRIRAAHADERPVYIEGFQNPLPARLVGPFSALPNERGLSRSDWRQHLAQQFRIESAAQLDRDLERIWPASPDQAPGPVERGLSPATLRSRAGGAP